YSYLPALRRKNGAARRTGPHRVPAPRALIADKTAKDEDNEVVFGIIRSVNEIEAQVEALEKALATRGAGDRFTTAEATEIVDRFFVSCQIAEAHIKQAIDTGYIQKGQENVLNRQISAAVQ